MAAADPLQALSRGIAAWNDFRSARDGILDLRRVTLKNAPLADIDFSMVDFDGARFDRVVFRGARFRNARINGVRATRCDFTGADFSGSELKGSEFEQCSLVRATFRGVRGFDLRIRRSDLTEIVLREADVGAAAHFYNVILSGADLEGFRGEGTAKRLAASPEVQQRLLDGGFARIDLPDDLLAADLPGPGDLEPDLQSEDYGLLEYADESTWLAVMRYHYFICHVSAYKDTVVRPLARALLDQGVRSWFDDERVELRSRLDLAIDFGIRSSKFGLVLVTPDFFGRRWTERELATLGSKRVFLLLHGVDVEQLDRLRPGLSDERHVLSWSAGLDAVVRELVEQVRRLPRSFY